MSSIDTQRLRTTSEIVKDFIEIVLNGETSTPTKGNDDLEGIILPHIKPFPNDAYEEEKKNLLEKDDSYESIQKSFKEMVNIRKGTRETKLSVEEEVELKRIYRAIIIRRIVVYLYSIKFGNPIIDIGDIRNSPYLIPYIEHFKTMTHIFHPGLYLIDSKGIYNPIDTGHCGVGHLVRVPRMKKAVYSLCDYRHIRIYFMGDYVILFDGVEKTRCGYKFIDKDYHIIPVAGVNPQLELDFTFEQQRIFQGEEELTRVEDEDDDDEDDEANMRD